MNRIQLLILLTLALSLLSTSGVLAGSHFFTDGQIPTGSEILIGVSDIENDWDNFEYDITILSFRFENPLSRTTSWFAEAQFQDYDNESTFSLGGGAMVKFMEMNDSFPVDLSARGSLFYGFEEEVNGYTAIPAFFNFEGRVIASRRMKSVFDWTPYAEVIFTYSKADGDYHDDSELLFDIGLGSRFRFDQLAFFVELLIGDQTGFGVGGSFTL